MPRYLGVDGGGSKTAFVLIDSDGRVLARATAPTSYYFNDGFDVVERILAQGVNDVCGRVGIDAAGIDSAFFGLPGYGEASGDVDKLDAVPARVLGHDRYGCDNDMVLRLGRFTGGRGRHQRHQRHRIHDLRPETGNRPSRRRLG